MRKIEFRAWHTKEKIMLPGICWCDIDDSESDFKLMQFTGLLDGKGNKIFEGDILQSSIGTKTLIGLMKWDKNRSGWKQFLPIDRWYIIGNRYENTDLLKEIKC